MPIKPKQDARHWNSLEMAKIAVAATTPLALFALGYCVSTTATKQAVDREEQVRQQAFERQAAAEKAGRAREDQLRIDAGEAARRAGIEAFQRQRDLQREADAREAALRAQSQIVEAGIRRETRRESIQDRILSQRLRLWTEASPILALIQNRLKDIFSRNAVRREESTELLAKLGEAMTLIDVYQSYFPVDFVRAYRTHVQACYDLLHVFVVPPEGAGSPAPRLRAQMVDTFRQLEEAARQALAVS